MFCTYCGRSEGNECHCQYNKKIHPTEAWILLISFLVIPFFVSGNLIINGEYEWISFVQITNIWVSAYLIVVAIFTFLFKKSYLALFFGCHQKIERTLNIFGHPLNICARCTGIYIGILAANLLFMFIHPSLILFILGVPLLVDGILQKRTDYFSTNFRRLMTGVFFGPSVILIFTGIHHMIIVSIQYFL